MNNLNIIHREITLDNVLVKFFPKNLVGKPVMNSVNDIDLTDYKEYLHRQE